jgi:hypothetical protein
VANNIQQNSLSKFKIGCLAVAALLASIACSRLISTEPAPFQLPMEFEDVPMNPSGAYMARYKVAFRDMLCGNYTIHFATCGALLGLALGALGATRNNALSNVAAILGGVVGGALLAGLGGFLLGQFASFGIENDWQTTRFLGFQVDPFIQTTLLQCFIWAFIGIGIGLGCTTPSFSFARILKGIQGGLIGGAVAGTIYSVIAAVFFSTSSAIDFVPKEQMERTIWAILCGLSIYAGLAFALKSTPAADAATGFKELVTNEGIATSS